MDNTPLSFAPPRGMRDFYPEDMLFREHLFETWKMSARRFGFLPYDACVVESLDLLRRKAGEEISEQIYAFADKSGRELALRAEMTPTLARMIAARQGSLRFPLKWYAIAQCFRYERMTRGRKREHYQWNLDIVGAQSVLAETEVIAAAASAMKELGFGPGDYRIRFNNRALLSELLEKLGIQPQHHAATFLALDKRGKIPDGEIEELLRREGLPSEAVSSALELMAITTLQEIENRLGGQTPALRRIRDFQQAAEACGIIDLLIFDLSVVRGLSYYTGIVFEAFDIERKFRAIFGGGRYDNLLGDIGARPMTAVGLGFGDVVIAELLREKESGTCRLQPAVTAVGYMSEQQAQLAIRIASALRRRGRNVDMRLSPEKPRNFFSYAGGGNTAEAVFIGPDEAASGILRFKDLSNGQERQMAISELLEEHPGSAGHTTGQS